MSVLSALIVDDERLARKEVRRLLGEHPEIEIVGEAADADQARQAILEIDPDLLFLDVQMPGESGFDLLESLDSVPHVVFTTAYDDYALRAFGASALDYLVKPIDPKRLAQCVSRLTSILAGEPEPSSDTPLRRSQRQRVFLKEGDRCWLVDMRDIHLFESEGNSVRVCFDRGSCLVPRTLNQLEKTLDPHDFFRANRRQIIRVAAVASVDTWFAGRLLVKLEDKTEVTLSRRRAKDFRKLLEL